MLRALVENRLNVLIVAVPAAWLLAVMAPHSPWLFLTAAVSLVPLAGLIGLGTEQTRAAVRACRRAASARSLS